MSFASRLLGLNQAGTRASAPTTRPARPPKGASTGVWYSTPGQPQVPEWNGLAAIQNGYLASIYVMQPVRIIASALGSLPFRVGADPSKPGDYNPDAPMAQLLGPPQGGRAAQGPNPATSPRNLWIWSITQRLLTGRMAWETVTGPGPGSDVPSAIWPLVSAFLNPIPSAAGSNRWFDGYQYQLPSGRIDYTPGEVFYGWRPSQLDWRQPESALQAANMPASLQIALDRYMWALAKNGLSARKMVITPEFAEDDERRAWEEQFASEFTGYDNGGRVLHGYYEDDPMGSTAAGARTPPIQVVDLAESPADAQVLQILEAVKNDMLRTWRVPLSWMGDSSARTYENASQEAKNFWQGPVLEAAAEIIDDVNMYLSPRFGDGLVGWFDFSNVEALKGGNIFAPIDPIQAKTAGFAGIEDAWRNDVGLPPLDPADAYDDPPPAIDDTPGGASKSNFGRSAAAAGRRDAGAGADQGIKAAGLAVKALDTGRVLLLQRALVEDDPAAGCWEFPGGCLEDGEHPLAAAVREWQEETGAKLPQGTVAGAWTSPNGVYRGYVYLIGHEADLAINLDHEDRHILNPDDPDGDQVEVLAWWDPVLLPGMTGLRPEARTSTDWDLLASAGADQVAKNTGARYDTSPLGVGKNWVTDTGGLDPFLRAIAHALLRSGHSESEAIQIAVGTARRWAAGGGKVTGKTRAKAAKAVARWEAQKAAAHTTSSNSSSKRDAAPVTEGGTAGLLLPQALPATQATATRRHLFTPSPGDKRRCAVKGCGRPVTASVHGLTTPSGPGTGSRHAGPGHESRPSGHAPSIARLRKQTARQVDAHATSLEPQLAEVMRSLFAKQAKATLARITGRRGAQMLTRATGDSTPPTPGGTPTPPVQPTVDPGLVFDLAHWLAETRAALNPVYAAVTALTVSRLQTDLHPEQLVAPDNVFSLAQAAAKRALDGRGSKLADTVTRTTYQQIATALAEGVAQGDGIQELADRVRAVFDEADRTRAETIARTEVLGSLAESAQAYAENLPAGLVAHKEWLAAHDARVRPAHREADGQKRQVGEPFMVGGSPMMQPGDQSAPPDETINCRCTVVYIPTRIAKPAPVNVPVASVA